MSPCQTLSRGGRPRRLSVLAVWVIALSALFLPWQFAVASEDPAAKTPAVSLSSPEGGDGVGPMAEVEACVRANAPRKTMEHEARVTTLDKTGADRTLEWKLYWKRDKQGLSRIFLRVEAPFDLRGASVLLIERDDRADDMWMYLPELEKVRRISSRTISGSLFGTDFSYEDIQRLQVGFNDASGRRLPDAEVENRPVYVVEVTPGPELASRYSRIVSYIDREYCVPLKTEFFEDSDVARKVMTIDPKKVSREANSWIPREVVLRDLDRETETRLVVAEIEIDGDIPDRRFTQTQLARGR